MPMPACVFKCWAARLPPAAWESARGRSARRAADDIVVEGEDDCGRAVTQVQLGEEVVDVGLYGAFADSEISCDLDVGPALSHQRQHLAFPIGEAAERGLVTGPARRCGSVDS